MNRVSKILAAALFCAAVVSAQTPNTAWYSNPAANTFSISTADELAGLAQLVNAGNSFSGKTIVLTRGIDLSAYGRGYNNGKGWTPIGYENSLTDRGIFSGVFDGRGYTVSNLYVDDAGLDYAGLFGYVGGAAGTESIVRNLGVTGSVTGGHNVGGVAGRLGGDGAIIGCYSEAAVSGYRLVGGVVGRVDPKARVEFCYSIGAVTGLAGGPGDGENVGGIAGSLGGHATLRNTVKNCYAAGAVSGVNGIGGIVGGMDGNNDIINCAALNPSVTASAANARAGRVAGNRGTASVFSGNAAYAGMAGDFSGVTGRDTVINGKSLSRNVINADGGIDGLFTDANVWTTAIRALPGLFGKTVSMSVHAPHLVIDQYKVTLNLNGGSGAAPQDIGVSPGGTIAAAPPTAGITRTGFIVDAGKWYLNANGTNEFVFGTTQVNDDITLYLRWTLDIALYDPAIAGAGTAANPYLINTPEQLGYAALMVNEGNPAFGGAEYRLMDDFSLSGRNWIPIGTRSNPFRGVFDGNRKTISDLSITDGGADAGLFGYVSSGAVMSLALANVSVSGGGNAGAVAGYVENGSVYMCYADGAVTGAGSAGGIVGRAVSSQLRSCYSTGAVNGAAGAGGIAGYASGGEISNCAALNPSVTGAQAGRIAGNADNAGLQNNAAFDGMTGGFGAARGGNTQNGADVSALDIHNDGTIGGRFTFFLGWIAANGKLPGFGAAEMPAHIKLYTVSFGVDGIGGNIKAEIDGTNAANGAWIPRGKDVVFTAAPIAGYRVSAWTVKIGAASAIPAPGEWLGAAGGAGAPQTCTVPLQSITGNVEVSVTFEAVGDQLAEIVFSNNNPIYTGSSVISSVGAEVRLIAGQTPLSADYTYWRDGEETDDLINAGTVTVIATINSGPHMNVQVASAFTISPRPLENVMIADIPAAAFNGEAQTPEIVVKYGSLELEPGKDYESVTYANNVNAGTASVAITGKGNYTGTASSDFTINRALVSVESGTYRVTKPWDGSQYATGIEVSGALKVTVNGEERPDFEIIAVPEGIGASNVNAADAPHSVTVRVTLPDNVNYILQTPQPMTIQGAAYVTPRSIAAAEVVVSGGPYKFNGFAQEPSASGVTVNMPGGGTVPFEYYDVAISGNRDAGLAVVNVLGKGNYEGTATGTFRIAPVEVTGIGSGGCEIAKVYDGTDTVTADGVIGSLTVTGILPGTAAAAAVIPGRYPSANVGYDYEIEAEVTLTGADADNYVIPQAYRILPLPARISPRNIAGAQIDAGGPYTYNGNAQVPGLTVSLGGFAAPLAANDDYTIAITNGGTNAGPASFSVTGRGNFIGSVNGSFTINRKTPEISDLSFSVPQDHEYTGEPRGIGEVNPRADVIGLGTITVLYDGSPEPPIDAGDYAVTVSIADDGLNYTAAELTLGAYTIGTVSIAGKDRVIPEIVFDDNAAVVAPTVSAKFGIKAGPNPVARDAGVVRFFVGADPVSAHLGTGKITGDLTIYDATGNVVRKINVGDDGVGANPRVRPLSESPAPRAIAAWDLRDNKGRPAPAGTYLARGTLKTAAGKTEKISIIIGVR